MLNMECGIPAGRRRDNKNQKEINKGEETKVGVVITAGPHCLMTTYPVGVLYVKNNPNKVL
jgi:hypothetical protein